MRIKSENRRDKNYESKLFKKSAAFKMGIPRNGFRTSRSLSPVIIQEALAKTANSRNLLSFVSRQSVKEIFGLNNLELTSILFTNTKRSSSFTKYLSNFSLNKTSINNQLYCLKLPVYLNQLLY